MLNRLSLVTKVWCSKNDVQLTSSYDVIFVFSTFES